MGRRDEGTGMPAVMISSGPLAMGTDGEKSEMWKEVLQKGRTDHQQQQRQCQREQKHEIKGASPRDGKTMQKQQKRDTEIHRWVTPGEKIG